MEEELKKLGDEDLKKGTSSNPEVSISIGEINDMQSISIIICCYNSEPRLARLLAAIAKQKNCAYNNWEVLVINNNSTDNTRSLAADIFSSPIFSSISCRVVDEPQPGLSFAREKGFRESRYEYVLFCDDDNVMEENFIANALQLIDELPEVEIFGAWCKGEFEIRPPAWSIIMLTALAVGRPAAKSGFMQDPVNGACMLIKKSAYFNLKNKDFQFLLRDRKGNVLTSGGDAELCYAIFLSGGKIYFSEKLFFTHLIPEVRLQKKYFKKLYMVPATADYTCMIYQWVLKNRELDFNRFYPFILFNYCKFLAFCLKKMFTTGYVFYYTLLFKQRFSFLIYSLIHLKKIKDDFYKVTTLRKI